MNEHSKFPVSLLHLPLNIRLGSVLFTFPICILIYALVFPTMHNGASVALPTILAAWFFRYRGMLICAITSIITVLCIRTFFLHISLGLPSIQYYEVTGILALLIIGTIIAYLRSTVDIVEAARQKANQAEKETQIAYKQQQENLQQKDRFLMHINHELRSPLTTIYGSLQLLQKYHSVEEPLPEELQLQCIQHSMQSCEDLIKLVNHVLEATTLNEEEIHPRLEAIPLHQIIQEVLNDSDLDIPRSYSLNLQLPEQLKVLADYQFLRQIFWHLLSNIRKYCPQQTPVTISTTYNVPECLTNKALPMVCIRIQDAGPGIPPEERTRLFAPFERLQRDIATSTSGSGLGLAISKQLVETMDGSIWVESTGQPNEGSCFCVALPSAV